MDQAPRNPDHQLRAGDARPVTGQAAGVPFLAVPPPGGPRPGAPVVVAWHLLDPPRTEAAFAAALPLLGLDAWRVYLGLPLSGSRLPPGGFEELMLLGSSDAVLNLYEPIVCAGAEEAPTALAALDEQLDLGLAAIGIMGGSIGSAVALLVCAESQLDIDAAVLVSPVAQLRAVVDATARSYGVTYHWSQAAQAVADRLDFVARAEEIAGRRRPPAMLLVVGEDDEPEFHDPAVALRDAIRGHGGTEAEWATVPGMAHALADEPGIEPAPQTSHAATVDRLAVRWFQHQL